MSSYYENNNASWSAAGRQPSWEQQAPPSRTGTASASRDESAAFSSQFEAIAALQSMFLSRPQAHGGGGPRDRKTDMVYTEIDRTTDNLVKSGKWMGGGMQQGGPGRRESMPPVMGRPYGEFDNRGNNGPSRHHSVSEYDGNRSGSAAGLQGYYANQRFQPQQQQQQQQQAQAAAAQAQAQAAAAASAAAQQQSQPPRANEAEQMMQAKRRMAAQRERELRNYHQEQQYNRSTPSGVPKSDRSMSPNTGMSEDERRELIARQHRALYGNDSNLYSPDGTPTQRRQSQDVRVGSISGVSGRGASPLAFDPFQQPQTGATGEPVVQMPSRDLPKSPNSNASPSSNAASAGFSLIDTAQQSSRTSASSPSASPPLNQGGKQATAAGVVPIGTRPPQPAAVTGLNKRSTTPLPSPLSYGFNANGEKAKTERSASAASSVADNTISGLGASWASNGSGWGGAPKNTLGVQASVWG